MLACLLVVVVVPLALGPLPLLARLDVSVIALLFGLDSNYTHCLQSQAMAIRHITNKLDGHLVWRAASVVLAIVIANKKI